MEAKAYAGGAEGAAEVAEWAVELAGAQLHLAAAHAPAAGEKASARLMLKLARRFGPSLFVPHIKGIPKVPACGHSKRVHGNGAGRVLQIDVPPHRLRVSHCQIFTMIRDKLPVVYF